MMWVSFFLSGALFASVKDNVVALTVLKSSHIDLEERPLLSDSTGVCGDAVYVDHGPVGTPRTFEQGKSSQERDSGPKAFKNTDGDRQSMEGHTSAKVAKRVRSAEGQRASFAGQQKHGAFPLNRVLPRVSLDQNNNTSDSGSVQAAAATEDRVDASSDVLTSPYKNINMNDIHAEKITSQRSHSWSPRSNTASRRSWSSDKYNQEKSSGQFGKRADLNKSSEKGGEFSSESTDEKDMDGMSCKGSCIVPGDISAEEVEQLQTMDGVQSIMNPRLQQAVCDPGLSNTSRNLRRANSWNTMHFELAREPTSRSSSRESSQTMSCCTDEEADEEDADDDIIQEADIDASCLDEEGAADYPGKKITRAKSRWATRVIPRAAKILLRAGPASLEMRAEVTRLLESEKEIEKPIDKSCVGPVAAYPANFGGINAFLGFFRWITPYARHQIPDEEKQRFFDENFLTLRKLLFTRSALVNTPSHSLMLRSGVVAPAVNAGVQVWVNPDFWGPLSEGSEPIPLRKLIFEHLSGSLGFAGLDSSSGIDFTRLKFFFHLAQAPIQGHGGPSANIPSESAAQQFLRQHDGRHEFFVVFRSVGPIQDNAFEIQHVGLSFDAGASFDSLESKQVFETIRDNRDVRDQAKDVARRFVAKNPFEGVDASKVRSIESADRQHILRCFRFPAFPAVFRKQPVYVNVYNLNEDFKTLNNFLKNPLWRVGGVYHSAIEVFGREFSYGYARGQTGVGATTNVRQHNFHDYRETLLLGYTYLSIDEVDSIIDGMRRRWWGDDYDLLNRNCCHFADELARIFGVGKIPAWIWNFAWIGDRARANWNSITGM